MMSDGDRARVIAFAKRTSIWIPLAIGGLYMLVPLVWMLLTAFRTEQSIFSGSYAVDAWTLENFRTAFTEIPWARYYTNGVIVTGSIFLAQLVFSIPAAYALARFRFRGSRLGFRVVLLCLMVPVQITAVPIYVVFSKAGLVDTLSSLILPFIGSAFGIFLFRQFILTIPSSVFESARMDGVGHASMVWRIVVPTLSPAILSFAIFSFTAHWNDYFWPSVMLRSTDAATVPYGVVRFASGEAGPSYGPQMAAATLAIAPLVITFLLAQKHFIRGMALNN